MYIYIYVSIYLFIGLTRTTRSSSRNTSASTSRRRATSPITTWYLYWPPPPCIPFADNPKFFTQCSNQHVKSTLLSWRIPTLNPLLVYCLGGQPEVIHTTLEPACENGVRRRLLQFALVAHNEPYPPPVFPRRTTRSSSHNARTSTSKRRAMSPITICSRGWPASRLARHSCWRTTTSTTLHTDRPWRATRAGLRGYSGMVIYISIFMYLYLSILTNMRYPCLSIYLYLYRSISIYLSVCITTYIWHLSFYLYLYLHIDMYTDKYRYVYIIYVYVYI